MPKALVGCNLLRNRLLLTKGGQQSAGIMWCVLRKSLHDQCCPMLSGRSETNHSRGHCLVLTGVAPLQHCQGSPPVLQTTSITAAVPMLSIKSPPQLWCLA